VQQAKEGRKSSPLNTAHLLVTLLCEPKLTSDHGLEARVEVRNSELDELRETLEKSRVHHLVHGFGFVVLGLRLDWQTTNDR
jgi:hypothetical protein